ncbi:MAG: hypothetical protein A3B95_02755 [Candidatus Doudnabacteria bacterium RIFCSPHIGHO2_02_FULL_43_13b]|nr:MAG: hypothetical protein A3B95_02755 [Candidatus Doudnabacteria bacterium RIFCSPHIGHO2_02_FULL_43_13b]
MLKKIIFSIIIFFIIIGIIFAMAVFRVVEDDSQNKKLNLLLNKEEKSLLKSVVREIKNWVYKEATIHNPEGDVLPDELDDEIIKGIKNKVE